MNYRSSTYMYAVVPARLLCSIRTDEQEVQEHYKLIIKWLNREKYLHFSIQTVQKSIYISIVAVHEHVQLYTVSDTYI